jgi:hypothetical protein
MPMKRRTQVDPNWKLRFGQGTAVQTPSETLVPSDSPTIPTEEVPSGSEPQPTTPVGQPSTNEPRPDSDTRDAEPRALLSASTHVDTSESRPRVRTPRPDEAPAEPESRTLAMRTSTPSRKAPNTQSQADSPTAEASPEWGDRRNAYVSERIYANYVDLQERARSAGMRLSGTTLVAMALDRLFLESDGEPHVEPTVLQLDRLAQLSREGRETSDRLPIPYRLAKAADDSLERFKGSCRRKRKQLQRSIGYTHIVELALEQLFAIADEFGVEALRLDYERHKSAQRVRRR